MTINLSFLEVFKNLSYDQSMNKYKVMTDMKKVQGFTIVELMVTLLVASVLIAMAGPPFLSSVRNNRILSATNQLVSHLSYARSEAIRLNTAVNLGRTSSTPSDWAGGWTVYTDTGSATGNSAFGGSDVLLRSFEGYDGGTILITPSSAGNQWIAYRSNGTLSEGGSTVLIAVCDDRGVNYGRLITVSVTGRPSVTTGTPAAPLASCSP